jgi:hypothetical protein
MVASLFLFNDGTTPLPSNAPKEILQIFNPSVTITPTGDFGPASLMNMQCSTYTYPVAFDPSLITSISDLESIAGGVGLGAGLSYVARGDILEDDVWETEASNSILEFKHQGIGNPTYGITVYISQILTDELLNKFTVNIDLGRKELKVIV